MKFVILILVVVSGLALPAGAQLRLCEQTYGNSATSNFRTTLHAAIRAGNGVIAAGLKRDKATNQPRRYLLRFEPSCDTVWTRIPSTNLNAVGNVVTAMDGNYVFVGLEVTSGITEHFLEKFSPSGSLIWRKKNLLAQNSGIARFMQLPDSGFFLLGADNAFKQQFFLLRTNKLGNQTGVKTHNILLPLSLGSGPADLLPTKDGNIIVYGTSYQTGWIYKLNMNGDSLKYKEVNISNRDDVFGSYSKVLATSDSGFVAIVTSIQPSGSSNNPDSISYQNIVKLDKNLNKVWRYKHPVTSGYDINFSGITELTDGSVVILSSGVSINANATYQLLRFSKTGQLKKTIPFTSGICQRVSLSAGVYLGDSTVYVVGFCYPTSANSNVDGYVARLSIGQVITRVKEEVLSKSNLGQSFPNPATETTIIPFNLPNSYKQARILIQDITGRKVGNHAIKKNSSSLEVNLRDFCNGLYTYTLLVDEKPVATKKLAVMR